MTDDSTWLYMGILYVWFSVNKQSNESNEYNTVPSNVTHATHSLSEQGYKA